MATLTPEVEGGHAGAVDAAAVARRSIGMPQSVDSLGPSLQSGRTLASGLPVASGRPAWASRISYAPLPSPPREKILRANGTVGRMCELPVAHHHQPGRRQPRKSRPRAIRSPKPPRGYLDVRSERKLRPFVHLSHWRGGSFARAVRAPTSLTRPRGNERSPLPLSSRPEAEGQIFVVSVWSAHRGRAPKV